MRKLDPLLRPIKKHHKRWLRNIQTSVEMDCPFDYVDITPKRVDILLEMDLIGFSNHKYRLTDRGKKAIEL